MSCISASLPDWVILALMTAGSNPVESELFRSSARRRRTNAALAGRLTGSRVAGLEASVMNVQFFTEIGLDSLAGNRRVYVSGTSNVWVLILFSFSLKASAPHADRRPHGSPPYSVPSAESISRSVRCILPSKTSSQSGGSRQTLMFPHLHPSFFAHASQSKRYLLLPCCSMLVTEPRSTIVLLGRTTLWNISKNRSDSSTTVLSSIRTVLTQSTSPPLKMPRKP